MPVSRWNRSQLLGKRLHWLLDLKFGGQIVRLSHEDIIVPSEEDGDLHYSGCLDSFTVPLALDLFSDSASLLSVKVAGVLPVNVPRLIALGHDFGAATGVLSQWIEGTDYDTRRVVLRGRVRDPEHGGADDPVNFALEDNLKDEAGIIPEIAAAVTLDTWGGDDGHGSLYYLSLADAEKGLSYPVVFGNPGKVSTLLSSSGHLTGSQGVWIWHSLYDPGAPHDLEGLWLLLAGHRVTARYVWLNTNTATTALRFPVKHQVDGLGREIAYVDWRINDPPAARTDHDSDAIGDIYSLGYHALDSSFQPDTGVQSDVYVVWSDPINLSGGGMQGPDGQTVRGAGDVIEAVLNFSDVQVDRQRIGAVKTLLNRFKIDGVIEAGVKPWDWLKANLLPILPVSVVKGPDGAYLVVWKYDATAADAVGHIDATNDATIEVSETIKYDTSKIANSFSLQYGFSLRTGNYLGLARLDAKYDPAEPTAAASFHCEASQRRYSEDGVTPAVFLKEMSSIVVYDDDTAYAILAWMAIAFSFATRSLEVLVPEDEWGWVERGNVLLISVDWLYLDRVVALVSTVEAADDGMLGLRLLLLDDPPRDSRVVAD